MPLDSSDSSDSEEEINNTCTDSVSVQVHCSSGEDESDSEDDYIVEPSIIPSIATQSWISAGYALLRICDYAQLAWQGYLQGMGGSPSQRHNLGPRARRSIVPIYDVNRNGTTSNQTETVPQWIYPCGITPNGTFPSGLQPFFIMNTTTWQYEQLRHIDYGLYFGGRYDEWSQSMTSWGWLLRADYGNSTDPHLIYPYGWKGNGDMILRHFGNFTPQYPYASYGISDALHYNGTCPVRLFNSTHFFGGGYIGLEDPGFEPLYPCGIRPDGLFTGEWLGFPNGTIPNNSYPFGYFPNGTFPYVDYFFNPRFDHAQLYLAIQNNQTDALQNYTRFLHPNDTRLHYRPNPRNVTDPFAECFGIYPRDYTSGNSHVDSSTHTWDQAAHTEAMINRNLIRMGLWGAQFGAEMGVIMTQYSRCARRRFAYALYLGTRTANALHATVDLISNLSSIIQNGHTDIEGELAIRNVLTLMDVFNLASESVYFCAPTIQRMRECVSRGRGRSYFSRLCSSLRRRRLVARRTLNRVAAVIGTIGVAGTAGLSAMLTTYLISHDQDSPEQRLILGVQATVAAVATAALAWMSQVYARREDA